MHTTTRRGALGALGAAALGAVTGIPAHAAGAEVERTGHQSRQQLSGPSGRQKPRAAAQAGFDSLVFHDDFESLDTFDLDLTGAAGYRWYLDRPFGWEPLTASDLSVQDSVLTIAQSSKHSNWGVSTISALTGEGRAFHHGYFEARMAFAVDGMTADNGWPSFWSYSVANTAAPQVRHFAELDFFEAGGIMRPENNFAGNIHDWFRTPEGNTGVDMHDNHLRTVDVESNSWHTYGCLWAEDCVKWYFDDTLLIEQRYGATTVPEPALTYPDHTTPLPAGSLKILDWDPLGLQVILGTGPGWPVKVDWVRVWN